MPSLKLWKSSSQIAEVRCWSGILLCELFMREGKKCMEELATHMDSCLMHGMQCSMQIYGTNTAERKLWGARARSWNFFGCRRRRLLLNETWQLCASVTAGYGQCPACVVLQDQLRAVTTPTPQHCDTSWTVAVLLLINNWTKLTIGEVALFWKMKLKEEKRGGATDRFLLFDRKQELVMISVYP